MVVIPGTLVDLDVPYISGRIKDDYIQNHLNIIIGSNDIPIMVGLTGSSGDMRSLENMARVFLDLGVVTFIPDAFARPNRKDCDDENGICALDSTWVTLRNWKIDEAKYAIDQISAYPWASTEKTILLGFSEGGIGSALYPGNEFKARIIIGWTCGYHDGQSYSGIKGPANIPIFAALAKKDPYYGHERSTKCRVGGRPHSPSVIVDSAQHNVTLLPEVRDAMGQAMTGNNFTSRRAFLTSAAVLPLQVSSAPSAKATPASDPLPGLWADRQRFLAAWQQEIDTDPEAGNFDTPRCLALERQQTAAEHALCTTPAHTIEGLAAQIEYAQSEFGDKIASCCSAPYTCILDTLVAGVTALSQAHALNGADL
ncbi:MAG: hypothetical protein JKY94_02375 [Rhodobacteraceae bacterium]|nr:hypothetical protein [Paracoccaceae bacterium]